MILLRIIFIDEHTEQDSCIFPFCRFTDIDVYLKFNLAPKNLTRTPKLRLG